MPTTPVLSSWTAVAVGSATANMVASKPTGVASGGHYIAVCWSNQTAATYTPPAGEGWIGPLGTASTADAVYHRDTTGSEATTYTFARSNTTGNGGVILLYVSAATFDTTTPIADCSTALAAATGNCVLPSVTATGASTLLISVITGTATTALTWTQPTGETVVATANATGTAIPYDIADEVVAAGATGTKTWSHTNSNAPRAALVAVNAAGVVGTVRKVRVAGVATTVTRKVRVSGSATTVTRKVRVAGVAV